MDALGARSLLLRYHSRKASSATFDSRWHAADIKSSCHQQTVLPPWTEETPAHRGNTSRTPLTSQDIQSKIT
ncbi:hypothetical protein VUR80DRAFT_6409 [Thermomyces stellatus]